MSNNLVEESKIPNTANSGKNSIKLKLIEAVEQNVVIEFKSI